MSLKNTPTEDSSQDSPMIMGTKGSSTKGNNRADTCKGIPANTMKTKITPKPMSK
jgi:hypothetical protein